MDIQVNDILTMKKQHPCGSKQWQVLRIGMDFKLKCLGCGHEHNCGVHGCAVIRDAINRISIAEWIPATLELPPDDREIFVLTRSKNGSRNGRPPPGGRG